MLRLESNLRLSFEEMNIRFQSIIMDHQDELDRIIKNTIKDFDFERVLTAHVNCKIQEGIDKAFKEIDVSEALKMRIWSEINKRLEEIKC